LKVTTKSGLTKVYKLASTNLYEVLISEKKKRGWYMTFSDIYTQPLYQGQLTFIYHTPPMSLKHNKNTTPGLCQNAATYKRLTPTHLVMEQTPGDKQHKRGEQHKNDGRR